ncbi:hypothetical protein V8D89_003766 [Ganoderma adspersum]
MPHFQERMSTFVKISSFCKNMWTNADSALRSYKNQEEDEVPKEIYLQSERSDETFPNTPGGDFSLFGGPDGLTENDMVPFWRVYRPWLAARGFQLFESCSEDFGRAYWDFPSPTTCVPALPYAMFVDLGVNTAFRHTPPPKFAPARDALMRDVMVKLVKKGSDEHRIYQELQRCSALSGNAFQGVIPPVAILDSQFYFSFVVMPRWGDYPPLGDFETVGGVLSLIRCLLKGLAFLHNRRIVHRDIDRQNIMTNCYTFGYYREKIDLALAEHRRGPNALHCLVDFDRSLKLPSNTPIGACRLPAEESLVSATPFQRLDLNLAEHDYDPFAFDVGCLGSMFQFYYADIIPIVPLLAPLFDQMTTHVISERFRAAEALTFFEDATRGLPSDVLGTEVKLEPDWDPVDDPNIYWAKLSPDFSKTWGIYRTPPPSLARWLLDVITRYRIGWRILILVRSVLRV